MHAPVVDRQQNFAKAFLFVLITIVYGYLIGNVRVGLANFKGVHLLVQLNCRSTVNPR